MFFNTLDNWLVQNKRNFSSSNILIEVDKKEGERKRNVVFSFKNKMASIELLNSGTIDFTIINSNTEKIIFTETHHNLTTENLVNRLNLFYRKIMEIG